MLSHCQIHSHIRPFVVLSPFMLANKTLLISSFYPFILCQSLWELHPPLGGIVRLRTGLVISVSVSSSKTLSALYVPHNITLIVPSVNWPSKSHMQPISSVRCRSAVDMPFKQITHFCLALSIKLTVHGSWDVVRECVWWLSARRCIHGHIYRLLCQR